MKTFGEIIKELREEQNLLLRQVSALTSIDQSIISKFEKGERKPSRAQVLKFAEVYKISPSNLIISWQSDKVAYDLLNENDAEAILKVAESKVKYLKTLKK
ncbi:MAG: helix-turn-helix transcriptional regulator [Bacteroidales bacterium]|nr:helix-turn-helix transcriptional regulator [Bacteroidales bacterium]